MAKKNFALGILISAQDKLTAPLNKMQKKFRSWGSSIENIKGKVDFQKKKLGIPALGKSFKDLGDKLKPIAAGIGALGVIAVGAFALVKQSASKLTALDDFSKTVGISIGSLQELRYASEQMGSSAEEMDAGIGTFTEGMGKARAGTGKLLGFLNKINPAFAKQLMATKTNEEGFNVMLRSLEKVTDPQKKLALATIAFGSAGESMVRVSGEGAEKLKAMRLEAQKFGLATQADIDAASSFDDGLNKLLFSLDAAKNKIAVGLMPVLSEAFAKMTTWLANNQDKIVAFAHYLADAVPKAINSCVTAFNTIINSPITKTLLWLIDKVGALNVIMGVLGVYIAGTFISILGSLISVGTALGFTFAGAWAALLSPVTIVIAAIAAVGLAAYGLYTYWDDICDIFKTAWDWLKKIGSFGLDKIAGLFGGSNTIDVKDSRVAKSDLGTRDLGATAAAKEYFNTTKNNSEAELKVSFDNMPKGARVETKKSENANLDLSMGYSMVSPL